MIRRLAVAAALAVCVALATGCAPEPEPTPSAPAFASEEEAFAAAEETYRAYVDALNQVDLSDPATFEPVFAWTTGDANAGERKSLSEMHANGWAVGGRTIVVTVHGRESGSSKVSIDACADVSGVTVEDAMGASQVSPDRPPIQSLEVTMSKSTSSPTGLLISAIEGGEADC